MRRIRAETPAYNYRDTAARFQVGNPDPGSRRQADMGCGKRGGDRRKPARHTLFNLGGAKKQRNKRQEQTEQILFHGTSFT
jgi:hypothetical protein